MSWIKNFSNYSYGCSQRDEFNDVSRYHRFINNVGKGKKKKTEKIIYEKGTQVMSRQEEIDDPTVLNKVRSRAVFSWNRNVILFFCVFTLLWAWIFARFSVAVPAAPETTSGFLNFRFDCVCLSDEKLFSFSLFFPPQLSVLRWIRNVPKHSHFLKPLSTENSANFTFFQASQTINLRHKRDFLIHLLSDGEFTTEKARPKYIGKLIV